MARSRDGRLVLFAIQFLWQFPHFWAIARLAHKDYTTAGFKLLPVDRKDPPGSRRCKASFTAPDDTGWFSAPRRRDRRTDEHVHPAGVGNLWMVYVSVLLFIRMDVAMQEG